MGYLANSENIDRNVIERGISLVSALFTKIKSICR